MQGINAQIIISAPRHRLNYDDIRNTIKQEFGDKIQGISGNSIKQAIIDKDDTHNVIFLKGIDERREHRVTSIADKITFPLARSPQEKTRMLYDLLQDNGIIIGYKTAETLKLKVGDQLNLMIPEPGSKKKILLSKKEVVVKGIFKVGLEEYDNNFAFISLDLLNEIFDEEGVDCVTITLRNGLHQSFSERLSRLFSFNSPEHTFIAQLKTRLPHLRVQSWKELYPALVSSLKLEKYVMFFILALISLVACMNMISLLFMQIQQKRKDIAIFKAMGLASNNIQSLFLYLGLGITLSASLLGLGLAAAAGYCLERYPFIELPDVYYVSYLPARMDSEIFLIVFVITMILGFCATWFPAQRTKKINIAEVLRQE